MNLKAADNHIPENRTQKIGDAEVSYLFYEGEGPPLIFLHATGFLPWLWHPLARDLAGSYRVFAPYFCDHRETDPATGGLSWVTLAEDLFRFCEALRLEKPFLVGHSMGATVSMMAHARAGLPAAGMVLIEPILLPSELYKSDISMEQHPLASKAIRRTNFWRDRDEALAYLHSRSLFQGWDEEIVELYIRHGMFGDGGGLRLTCSPLREAALFMGGVHYDPWPLLSRVSCPVLILEGEKSYNRELIDQTRIRSLIPDCFYHLVGGAGHLIPMEKPREVTSLIRRFFLRLRPGAEKDEEKPGMGSDGGKGASMEYAGAIEGAVGT
jgi:pimeloyl-ACP methyl ester carboxylesterase